MITTLLRPQILTSLNRWRHHVVGKKKGQDILLLSLALLTAFGAYRGTTWSLQNIAALPFLIYVPPSLPLGLILSVLLVMISISAMVTAIGSLYFSEDLDLWLAAPVPSLSLFLSKLIQIAFGVAWMPLTFILPVLLAFGVHYNGGLFFYLSILAVLIPYFAIPAALAALIAICVMALLDPRWTKIITSLVVCMMLVGIYLTIQSIALSLGRINDGAYVNRIVSLFNAANYWWSPASWASHVLSELLIPTRQNGLRYLALLYLCLTSLVSAAFVAFQLFHLRGVTRARQSRLRIAQASRKLSCVRTPKGIYQAMWGKEFRSILRDVAQSTQLLFLSFICLTYLMNVRLLINVDGFPLESREYWRRLFFMFHSCVAAFFTIALSTRLVFSSVSLEGRAFWMLRTAPIDLSSVLWSKLWFWYPPIALLSLILFGLGGFAVSERLDVTAIHGIASIFISFGIVGVGVGLGALFSDFAWDHPSHLVLGLGSFIFMLISICLVFLNTIPTWFIVQVSPVGEIGLSGLFSNRGMLVVLSLLVVASVNIIAARSAMRLGVRAISKEVA